MLGRVVYGVWEEARFELPLPCCWLLMRFGQTTPTAVATLLIFSMRAVDVGALLLSAWLEAVLQRRHCRVKDWPYSQAALTVCDFVVVLTFGVAALFVLVVLGRVVYGLWEEARFELPLPCCWLLMRFAQEMVPATLWIFSMRAADVGALLLSARLDLVLQRRRCRVKDWPYSQAATLTVCDFVVDVWCCSFACACDVGSSGIWCVGGGAV
jgi:hypothetical protein